MAKQVRFLSAVSVLQGVHKDVSHFSGQWSQAGGCSRIVPLCGMFRGLSGALQNKHVKQQHTAARPYATFATLVLLVTKLRMLVPLAADERGRVNICLVYVLQVVSNKQNIDQSPSPVAAAAELVRHSCLTMPCDAIDCITMATNLSAGMRPHGTSP